jgi:hypothetical protein
MVRFAPDAGFGIAAIQLSNDYPNGMAKSQHFS